MVLNAGASIQFAELSQDIANLFALDRVCNALASGLLRRDSGAATRASIAEGNPLVESHLRALQQVWSFENVDLSGRAVALVLRTAADSVAAFRHQFPTTQVVWTGPTVGGSFLRATREVVREILRGASVELLVVGYWIAARDDGEGIIEEFIGLLATAVNKGVAVNLVVDERVRADGRDNRQILVSAWPPNVALPTICTWRLPAGDQHLKLHAKVLIADRRDALVTSANLTSYAMDRNMEMGVRIVGRPAADMATHFDLLKTQGVLETYSERRTRR